MKKMGEGEGRGGKTAQILIIDDQEGIRRLLAEICLLLGYRVKTAATGRQALEMVRRENFQVAIIDLKMNGLDGLETMKLLKKQRKDLRAVFMTGYGDPKIRVKYMLKKPFDLQEVRKVLRKILNREHPE